MSRHLEPISDVDQVVLLSLVDTARDMASHSSPSDLLEEFRLVEAERHAPRTGTKLARVTAAAGETAAHALRLQAIARGEVTDEPWTIALARTGVRLSSWDWDERMGCALELRRTFKDLGDDHADVATIRPVRLVAAWLTHAGGEALVPASVRLCATVLESPARDHLGTAWFAVHGLTLLDHITGAGIGTTEGRATSEQAAYRARLKVAVTGINDAQLMSGTALAKRAGITRVTLTSWSQEQHPTSA